MTNMMDEIRRDNARFAREVEYVKEIAADDVIDIRTESADSLYRPETRKELVEAVELVKGIPTTDNFLTESTEIEKILNSDHDLTFDEMIGLK